MTKEKPSTLLRQILGLIIIIVAAAAFTVWVNISGHRSSSFHEILAYAGGGLFSGAATLAIAFAVFLPLAWLAGRLRKRRESRTKTPPPVGPTQKL